jgi:putative transposase
MNQGKHRSLGLMYNVLKDATASFVKQIIHGNLPLKTNLSSKVLPSVVGVSPCGNVVTINGGQYKQLIYKTASEIVRSNLDYVKGRTFKRYKKLYAYFKERNRQVSFINKRYKDLKINYLKRIDIDLNKFSINLDERFIDFSQGHHFDNFIRIKTVFMDDKHKNRRVFVNCPIKNHKHSNKFKEWTRKKTVRLSKDSTNGRLYLSFTYEKKIEEKVTNGQIGFDIGYKKLLSSSEGNHYGTHLHEIYGRLARKERGSRNYTQMLHHKKTEINRVINGLKINNNDIVVEDLKAVRYKSKLSSKLLNKLQYWSYGQVLTKLESLSQTEGFRLVKIDPAYTSQTCHLCGTIDRTARKGELYECTTCGLTIDADTNASIVILQRGTYSSSTQKQVS